jgi:putative flippase GtrA
VIAYTREKVAHLLKVDFIRFCIVGGTGFIINFVILAGLHKFFSVPIAVAQFVGAEIALFSNFILHHHWTYKRNKVNKTMPKLMLQFHMTTWPAILGSTLMVSIGVSVLHLSELVALITSSIIALFWNFGWSKYVIWRDIQSKEELESIAG